MRKINSLLFIIFALLFVVISCKDDPIIDKVDKDKNKTEKANKYVNNWIFEEMNIYYLWNDTIPKKPNFTLTPDKFFESLLNTYNKETNPEGDRFSWIDDDYTNLLGSLSGIKSDEIGFEYTFAYTDPSKTKLYAIVTYPKLGSNAYEKGVDRGRFITQVDGKDITNSNYRTIFSGTGSKTLKMADWKLDSESKEYVLKNSGDVTIQMDKKFAEIPVYLDSVYNINGTQIGYMVYNFFATDKQDDSHDYDKLLMNTLAEIKAKGATEMILDLRYNGGGRVSTAIALASALVKDRSTDSVLVTAEYNDIVHATYKRRYGANYNKDYFIDKIYDEKEKFVANVPNLNLNRLYVLVTGGSASASEFIINGLKPYMDVFLIGETTYGKNVGSISIYEEDDPKNKWGMQPIIVKYSNSNGESDFTAGFTPDIEIDEFETLRLIEFGNIEDPLLSAALNEITGNVPTRSMMKGKQFIMQPQMIEVENSNSIFKDKSRFEMIDDVRGETIKKLMK